MVQCVFNIQHLLNDVLVHDHVVLTPDGVLIQGVMNPVELNQADVTDYSHDHNQNTEAESQFLCD